MDHAPLNLGTANVDDELQNSVGDLPSSNPARDAAASPAPDSELPHSAPGNLGLKLTVGAAIAAPALAFATGHIVVGAVLVGLGALAGGVFAFGNHVLDNSFPYLR